MAVIESSDYQQTRDALSENPIILAMFWHDPTVKEIMTMTDDELKERGIASRVDGKLLPFSAFMNAANRRFRELEDASPDHRYTGPLHIGAVAEVILAQRDHVMDVRLRLIKVVSEKLHKEYTCSDWTNPKLVADLADQATDDLIGPAHKHCSDVGHEDPGEGDGPEHDHCGVTGHTDPGEDTN